MLGLWFGIILTVIFYIGYKLVMIQVDERIQQRLVEMEDEDV